MVFILGIGETVVGAFLTFAAGWLGFDKLKEKLRGAKQKVSGIAQELQEFSAELREEGFVFYADIVDHLVIRDLLGAIAAYRRLRKMFRNKDVRHAHFDKIFLGWIHDILADETRRMPFIKEVNRWKQDNPRDAAKLELAALVPIASQSQSLVPALTVQPLQPQDLVSVPSVVTLEAPPIPPIDPMVKLDDLAKVLAEKVSEKLPAVQPLPATTIPATVGK